MMQIVEGLMSNLVLDLAVLSWLIAQVLKVLINLTIHETLDLKLLISSGGMPSSHSALVCACAAAICRLEGFDSALFALGTVLALVVMYDACNVRRAAGEQARILNHIMEHWAEISPAMVGEELKELLGHTPLQVVMGALLGAFVGWFGVGWFG